MLAIVRFTLLAALFLPAAQLHADEASVKRAFEERFSGVKVDSVTRTPYLGLYEVVTGSELVYTDERVSYIFEGSIYEAKSRRNLTEDRLRKLSAINFDDLPLELAIKQVRGSGKRVVAVFSDPFCPYCRQLDQSLMRMDDLTVYTFLFPILRKDESPQMATRIWCASDRAKAYYDLMLSNRAPAAAGNCRAPVDRWIALGNKLGVSATPVSIASNGQRILGARVEDLKKLIDESVK